MSPESFRIIVLHTIRHKESGIIIRGYGNHEGRGSYFLKVGKNKKHTLSLLHPLSIIDIEIASKSFGVMKSIKEFDSSYKLKSIRSTIGKSAIAIFLSELTLKTIKEVEQNRDMFEFMERSVLELENIEEGAANFHLYFLVKYTGMLGYLPDVPLDTEGMLFDIPSAGYTSDKTVSDYIFDSKESELLSVLYRISPDRLKDLRITRELRNKFMKDILLYISYHTGHDIHCESLNVLQEVFAN